MASRLLDRLRRSLFRDGQEVPPELQEEQEEVREEQWEAELEEEECVSERLGGTLSFDGAGAAGPEDGTEGGSSGPDSDSDLVGEWRGGSTDASPVGPSPSNLLTRPLLESWWSVRALAGTSPAPWALRHGGSLQFEVTDASVVQDGSSKYVLYTVHVIQSGGSDKSPAVITRRYSDFQRLHATLRRHHGDLMERVCFPRKTLRRNFTAETIGRRSRAFEQYLSHLCALPGLQGALCVRHFFYLSDLQTAQLLIRAGRFQDASGPLLNAKRLQHKLGWASYHDNEAQAPAVVSHWLFTVLGLLCCFQEAEQLDEARDHCDHALHLLTPAHAECTGKHRPLPPDGRPHPLWLPLLQAAVRLSWQTGRDKRQWEELLQQQEEQGAGPDDQPTIKEFLVKYDFQEVHGKD